METEKLPSGDMIKMYEKRGDLLMDYAIQNYRYDLEVNL